jgi:hypothetical protein
MCGESWKLRLGPLRVHRVRSCLCARRQRWAAACARCCAGVTRGERTFCAIGDVCVALGGVSSARPEARGKLLAGDLAGCWCAEGACACARSVNDGLLASLWRASEPSLGATSTPARPTASAQGGGEELTRRAAAAKLDAGRRGCLGLWAGR